MAPYSRPIIGQPLREPSNRASSKEATKTLEASQNLLEPIIVNSSWIYTISQVTFVRMTFVTGHLSR